MASSASPGVSRPPSSKKKLKVLHIINTLGIGGAETVLYRLLTHSDRSAFDMQVIALVHDVPLGDRLRKAGIRVHCLHMSKKSWSPATTAGLIRLLRTEKPDLVQTWLQHSDLLGGMAAKLAGVRFVFWNVRHSTLHPVLTSRRTRIVSGLCALLSDLLPTRIVCCSESAREEQSKLGYAPRKMLVIPNGIDIERFKPDPEAYRGLRQQLGLASDALLVGAAGRFLPAKDHGGLIRAAAEIAQSRDDVHFVFCGDQVAMENPELRKHVLETGFADRFHLLGQRDDVPRILAALDIFISSSGFSEGFPNVICEAMATGVPCVATDVGDSARIVGETGKVVPPGQPSALAQSVLELCAAGTDALRTAGRRARKRISDHFALSRMVESYEQLYAETITQRR
jgi:glycosyltransferase involved in cell wall biosynthesis